MIREFFHHLFNPHCPICEIKPTCLACEARQLEINSLNRRLDSVLEHVFQPPSAMPQINVPQQEEEDTKPVQPRIVPWHVRKKMLEEQDRAEARVIAEQQKEVEEAKRAARIAALEMKLDIPNGEKNVESKPVENDGGTYQQEEIKAQG